MKLKENKVTVKLVGFLCLALVLWLSGSLLTDYIKAKLVETTKIEFQELQDTLPAEGYFIKKETVITAPQDGELKKLVTEGERVRIKAVVAEILTPSLETVSGQANTKVKTSRAGVLSYKLDGLENLLTLENWEKLNPKEVLNSVRDKSEEPIEKGKPLLKIIDNLEPVYLYLELKEDDFTGQLAVEGEPVKFNILNNITGNYDTSVNGVIKKVKHHEGYFQILIEAKELQDFLLKERKIEVQIVKNSYEGYVLPEASLVTKNGKNGVFLIYKKKVNWIAVEVLGRVDGKVAINSDENSNFLNVNSLVVVNPALVEEGQILR